MFSYYKNRYIYISLIIIFLTNVAYLRAQNSWVQKDKMLHLTILTDLDELINNRRRDAYQPAAVFFQNEKGEKIEMAAEVKPRGKYRRKICDFPPVKIKFPKKDVARLGIGKRASLKLVTHCLNDPDTSRLNVLSEYLAYRLFNQMTDLSFRVALVEVTYQDIKNNISPSIRTGFFIEDIDELAERFDGNEVEKMNIPFDSIAQKEGQMVAVFQYMIGNADWDFKIPRNLKYIQQKNGGKLLPIPYDFDFSGLVGASYAKPNVNLGLLTTKERAYLGNWIVDADLNTTLNEFVAKRERVMATIRRFRYLPKKHRKEMELYINDFYNNFVNLIGL